MRMTWSSAVIRLFEYGLLEDRHQVAARDRLGGA
jgi:hypothetical protein